MLCLIFSDLLLAGDVAERDKRLCTEHSAAGSSPQGIVRQADELPVIDGILSQPADRDTHPFLIIDIQRYLRPVILLQILDELLRCRRKMMLLRIAGKMNEPVDQLLFRRMLAHLQENSRRVTVQNRHADTLAGDNRFLCRDDDAILKPAEDPQRLPLALLLLPTDVRDDIPDHLFRHRRSPDKS